MNKDRRKRLNNLIGKLEEIRSDLETIKDEEQDAFDALPESLQSGDRGSVMETCINAMEEAVTSLEAASESIEEAVVE